MKVQWEWGWRFCLPLVYLSLRSPVPELGKLAAGRCNLQLDFLCLLLNLLLSVTGEIPPNASPINCVCFLILTFLNFTYYKFILPCIIGKPSSFLGKVWV